MVLTATLEKEKGGKLGLKLTGEDNKLYVTSISADGALAKAKTGLEVGMEVLEINGKSAAGMTSKDAATIMLETGGTLTIKARNPPGAFVTGTFNKTSPTTKVGLRLEDGDGKVMINSIREGTLAATTDLEGGMAIRLVNNTDCVGKDAMFVAQLLADAIGPMTVVAETSEAGDLASKSLISATLEKKAGAKLGLTLTEAEGRLLVTNIKEGGLVATTDLGLGMEIYSINNIVVVGKTSTEAATILIQATGTITILAFKPGGEEEEEVEVPAGDLNGKQMVTATLQKAPGVKLGLTLSEMDDKLVITKIKEGGLVAGSPLTEGMVLYSINNEMVEGKTSVEAAGMLARAQGVLTIVAIKTGNESESNSAALGTAAAAATAGAAAAAVSNSASGMPALPGGKEYVTATLQKQPGSKLGLTLSEMDDKLVVTKIKEGGLAAGSTLGEGMVLYSINDELVEGKSSVDAAGMLAKAQGTLVVVAIADKASTAMATAAAPPSLEDGKEYVTATLTKAPGAKLGITLSHLDNDKLVITKIKEGGLAAGSTLGEGMELYSINGEPVAGKSSVEAAGMLAKAQGTMTVVAIRASKSGVAPPPLEDGKEYVTATMKKAPGAKLGLKLSEVDDTLVITGVKEGGLAAASALDAGMILYSINGELVKGKSSTDAAGMLAKAQGTLTVVAIANKSGAGTAAKVAGGAVAAAAAAGAVAAVAKSGDVPPLEDGKEYITATMKKAPGAKLGLKLSEVDDTLVITGVKEGGLAAASTLDAGMILYSINGELVKGKSSTDAAGMLAKAQGTLTVVAIADKPSATGTAPLEDGKEYVTATMTKAPGAKLGLKISEEDGKLIITGIKEGGLAASSALGEGMSIYSINGELVEGKTNVEAAGMLAKAQGTLTVVAIGDKATEEEGLSTAAKVGIAAATAGAVAGVASLAKGGDDGGETAEAASVEPNKEVSSAEPEGDSAGAGAAVAAGTGAAVAGAGASDGDDASALPPLADGKEYVTTTIEKEAGDKLGLKLTVVDDDGLEVAAIKEGGLADNTTLAVGMLLYSINEEVTAGLSPADAATKLSEAGGTLTIVTIADKKEGLSTAAKVGIGAAVGAATAGALAGLGSFFKGGGDATPAVANSVPADEEGEEAAEGEPEADVEPEAEPEETQDRSLAPAVLAGAAAATAVAAATADEDDASALPPLPDGKEYITATIEKEPGAKLGLKLSELDDKVVVTGVREGGLAAGSVLAAGMVLYAINGESVEGKSSVDAAGMLAKAEGTLTVVAIKDKEIAAPPVVAAALPRSVKKSSPGTLTMAVINKGPGQRLGLRLGLKNDKVMVSGLGEGSLAAQTDLQAGMVLVLVNNKSCAGLDTSDVAKLLSEAGDNVIIVAETPGPQPTPKSLVPVVVTKEKDAKVGVTLTQQGGRLVITKIKEESLFANTDLRVGMEVMSIDNVSCIGKTSADAAALFKGVEGTLMMIAKKPAMAAGALVTAAVAKDDPSAKLGIRLGMTGGVIVVTNISEGSLLSSTDLESGMAVRTINNVDLSGMESTEAANLLKESEGILTILAESRVPGSASGADVSSLVAASVLNSKGANLGLTLSQVEGKLVVTGIEEGGLFFGTALRVGMQVLKINNVDCAILTQEASELLMAREGTLTVLAKRNALQKGTILTAVLVKNSADTKVGLGLGSSNGLIVVTKIKDGTLGAMTDLRPGMVIRSVNNVSTEGKDSMGVAKLLSEGEGYVTIVAEVIESSGAQVKPPKYFAVTVQKEMGDKVGVALTQKGGVLVVTKISEDGLMAATGLEVGMEVVTINNVDCTSKSTPEAAEILKSTEGRLTILARKPRRAPGSLVTASVNKESVDTKVGLKLGMAGGAIVITGLAEGSLVAATELEPGMVVKSINNTDCTGLETAQAANLLKEAEGILTILAEVPKGREGGAGAAVIASLVTATAMKEKDVIAGVTLERQSGHLVVTKVEEEGALFGTGLRLGMEVISINNVDASVLTTVSANELLKKEGALTILAKPVSLPPGTLLTAAFTKPTVDTKVGLGLGVSNGVIVITKVRDGTVSATTNLEPGMVVRAINNIDCTKRTSDAAAKILMEAVGTITVLAEKPRGTGVDMTLPVQCLFAVTFKKGEDGKVGTTLTNESGTLTVGSIAKDSVVANTRLRVGMEIVKINNVDCSGMSPTEAAALLSKAEGSITVLAKKASAPPGTIITATMKKVGDDAKVGLGLGMVKGAMVITNIKDGSLAATTDLEVGMLLRTINNVDCGEIEVVEAANLLKEAKGKLTVVAEARAGGGPSFDSFITATIDKEKDAKVGLTVANKGSKIFVSKINPDGLIAGSGLAVGMELLSIDNTVVAGMSSSEVSDLLLSTEGTMTLLAKKAALPPGSLVTAVVTKENVDSKVGLRLALAGGVLVVSSLAEDSLASATELKPGMILKTINNVDVTGMQPPEAASLLKEAEGSISILAVTPRASGVEADAPTLSTFVTVSVLSTAGVDVGVKLVREDGKLLVSEISDNGALAGSALLSGMEVVKINNVDCGVLSASAATGLLTAEESLTILARKPVLAPGTLVTAVVKKESQDDKVGLKLGMSQGMLVVTGVKDGSLASTTPLDIGMVVRSINNMDCSKKDSAEAAKLLAGAVGLVTILAEVPNKSAVSAPVPSLITASVDKPADTDSGVTFKDEDGAIVVASIAKDGLWSKTRLRVGMELLQLNWMSSEGRSAGELETFLQDAEGKVTVLAKAKTLPPGTLVSAVLNKESDETKVGLAIGTIGGKSYITGIRNDTLASPTDLRAGMQLRLINNVDCSELGSAEVGKLLLESEGTITVVAQVPGAAGAPPTHEATPITATVLKEQDAKVGLTLTDREGKVYVSKILDDGLLAPTALKVGMEVISIDNHQCTGKKSSDCAALLMEAEGYLTIVACEPVLPPGSFVTAVITKESADTKVGLRMGDENGKIIVTGIAEGSLASFTPLEVGMYVRSIDNVDCTGLSTSDAAKLLMDGEGSITILASTPDKNRVAPSSLASICAVTVNNTSDAELGMEIERKGGSLVVSKILKTGLIFGTALRVGMEIVTINNVDCSFMSAKSGESLMAKEGMLTILGRKKQFPPGYLVTAVIVKDAPGEKVGLGMGSKNDNIYVTKIRDGSLAALTELQPGMIVRTIDNVELKGMTLVDAANLLANAEGTVTIAAEMPSETSMGASSALVTATVMKEKDEKTGLTLAEGRGMLYISGIQKDSIFAGTLLSVGMVVLAINNKQASGLSVQGAASHLQSIEGDLTIVAKKPAVAPGGLLTASITKESVDSKIGIRLAATAAGVIVVKNIADGSLASKTDLKPGMVVKSIDNVPCGGTDAVAAAKLLTSAEGTLTVIAEAPSSDVRSAPATVLLTVTVTKDDSNKLGLVVDKKNGKTVVTKIDEDGLLYGSGLRIGMEVLKINNVDCAVLTKTSAARLLETDGLMTILARKTLKRAGVLVAVTLKKPTLDTKVGLGLGKSNDRVIITKIADGTPGAMTEIQQGMVIRQINNTVCKDMTTNDVAKILKESEGLITLLLETPKDDQVGSISLVKSLAVAAVDNDEEGELGLTLMNNGGKLVVAKVAEDGKFAKSGLRPGMALLSINNSNCSRKTADEALTAIEQATGVVSILAQKPFLGPGEILAVPITKSDPSDPIGLGLGSSEKTGKIIITNVKEGSKSWFSELYTGMAIKSINNQELKGKKPEEAAKILSEQNGMFTIAAESMLDFVVAADKKTPTTPSIITATIMKEKGAKVGLLLGEKGNKLFISKIVPGGLMSETDLKVGMQVLSINNVECDKLRVADAATILGEAEGAVTILAKQPALAPGALITVSAVKETPDASVGIGLGAVNGKVVVSSIKYGSPASKTDLQVGMALKGINNVDCSKKNAQEIGKLFANATGNVMILAEVPYPPAKVVPSADGGPGRVVYDNKARPPPYGLQEGGVWERRNYVGEATVTYTAIGCACAIVPGVYSLLNPVDVRDVYIYEGKAYTAGGECVGVAKPENQGY